MECMLNSPFPALSIGSVSGDADVYDDLDADTSVSVVPADSQLDGWAYKPANGTLKLNVGSLAVGANW